MLTNHRISVTLEIVAANLIPPFTHWKEDKFAKASKKKKINKNINRKIDIIPEMCGTDIEI